MKTLEERIKKHEGYLQSSGRSSADIPQIKKAGKNFFKKIYRKPKTALLDLLRKTE